MRSNTAKYAKRTSPEVSGSVLVSCEHTPWHSLPGNGAYACRMPQSI